MITVLNLDPQADPDWGIFLACQVIHGLSAHITNDHFQNIQTFLDKDGRVVAIANV